jgi:hypothetical protein
MITKWCRFKYSYLELLLLTNFQYFEDFGKHSNSYTKKSNLKNLKSFKFLPVQLRIKCLCHKDVIFLSFLVKTLFWQSKI